MRETAGYVLKSFAVAGSMMCCATLVLAQATTTPTPTASSDESIGEIIVTAERKSESLQKVPISVAVFDASSLQQASVTTGLELQFMVPGLVWAQDTGAAEISIRGVGTGYSGPGLEGSVAVYVDDSYFVTQDALDQALFDLSQVQVLKGPQGTLYGRNATGGAIVLTTQDPIQGDTSASVSAGYGQYDWQNYQAIVNLPVTPTLALRIGADYDHRNGYIRNLAFGGDLGGYEKYLLRAKAGWEPNSDLKVVAKVEFYRDREPDDVRQQRLAGSLCVPCVLYPGVVPATGFYTTEQSAPVIPATLETVLSSLRVTYNINNLVFASTTAYRTVTDQSVPDQDAEPPTFESVWPTDGGRKDRSLTQEFRLSSSYSGPLNFTAGGFYENDSNNDTLKLFGDAFGPLTPAFANRDHTSAFSFFGEGYYEIVPALKLTLGARYNEDDKHHSFVNNSDAVLVFGETTNSLQAKFVDWTPRVVLDYDAGIGNYYVSYNRGFKSGGFNSPAGNTQPVINPEVITSYEAGAKFDLADGKVRLNMAAFHYNWSNLQVAFINSSNGGLYQENAAAAKNDGFETSFDTLLTKGLTLNLSGLYMHSRYTSFASAAVYDPSPTVGLVQASENLAGFPTTRAPRFSGSARVNYEFPISGGSLVDLSALESYTGQYDFNAGAGGPLRFDRQTPVALLNMTAKFTLPGDRLSFTGFVNNATERHYAIVRNTTALGAYEGVGEPRLFGIRVNYQF